MSENDAIQRLFEGPLKVINVGLEGFGKDLRTCGVENVHIQWSPPAGGDPEMARLLAKLGM